MSDLPSGWASVRLADVADIIAGQAPPGSSYNKEGLGMPLYQGKADFGDLTLKPPRSWTSEPTKMAAPDDVLVSVRAPVGPSNLAREPCAIGRGLAAIRARNAAAPRYLLYAIRASVGALEAQATGTTFAAVTKKVIESHEIPLAPLPEQERIVAAIEEEFSRLDAGTRALKRADRALSKMRIAVLRAAVSGRLAESDAEGSAVSDVLGSPARPSDEKRVRRVDLGVPDRVLPKGWAWVQFGDLTVSHDRKRIPLKRADRAKRQGPYSYYGAQGVIDYIDDFLFDGEYLLVAEDGANLTSRAKPVASVVSGQFWVNNHAHVVQPKPGVLSEYLAIALNADPLTGLVAGTAQPKLTAAALNGLYVPVPSTNTQRKIVDEVNRQLSLTDGLRDALSAIAARSIGLRSRVLASAFAGRLVPQDPRDEPAAALLANAAPSHKTHRRPQVTA